MNTHYYVEYEYEGIYGYPISDRHRSETKEEAERFIAELTKRRKVIQLTLITYEERIG